MTTDAQLQATPARISIIARIVPALSFALPAFLFMRERALERAKNFDASGRSA